MSKRLSVTIPDDLKADLERSARKRRTTTSELVREALRAYVWEVGFEDVQAYGAANAQARAITQEDVEPLIDQLRSTGR